MKKIVLILVYLYSIFISQSSWSVEKNISSWSSGYDNCILKNMIGVGSDLAAKTIMDICLSKYKDQPITICVEIDAFIQNKNIYFKDINNLFSGNNYCEYPSGVVKSKGKVYEGKKDGKWTWFSEKGNIGLEKNYKNGLINGKVLQWYSFRDSVLLDSSKIYNQIPLDGQLLKEENYKDDKKNGKSTSWYRNGQMQLEETYKDDKKDGKSTLWNLSGLVILEVNYKNDKRDGKLIRRYDNGQIQLEEFYKNDKKDGKSTSWYKNGQTKLQETYKNDKKDGKLTLWNINGQILENKIFKDDLCISGDC